MSVGGLVNEPRQVAIWDAHSLARMTLAAAAKTNATALCIAPDSRRAVTACQISDEIELWESRSILRGRATHVNLSGKGAILSLSRKGDLLLHDTSTWAAEPYRLHRSPSPLTGRSLAS
jgi:hypothetical protein